MIVDAVVHQTGERVCQGGAATGTGRHDSITENKLGRTNESAVDR